jgi:hypothetical protein
MNTCNLFHVTNIFPDFLFNTCILALYLDISNIFNHNHFFSFDIYLREDGHCRPKHVTMSHIYKLLSFYRYAVVGINVVNYCLLQRTWIMLNMV